MTENLRELKTGHLVQPFSEEEFNQIKKNFPMYDGLVRLLPQGFVGHSALPDFLDGLHDFHFKPSDVFVMTYPKSGTTWTQEIVWTLLHNPDLNNPMANLSSDIRSPHIEADVILSPKKVPKLTKNSKLVQFLAKNALHRVDDKNLILAFIEEGIKDPRVIKSHLPLALYPKKLIETSKVIYLARDPRDVLISKYHFFKTLVPHSFSGTLDDFVDYFIDECQTNHPYWQNVKAAYDLKDHPNMLFMYFEDLKTDAKTGITKISNFLNLERSDKQIQNVMEYTDFKAMKQRSDSGVTDQPMSDDGRYYHADAEEKFFRKGKTGNWKEAFTTEQVDKITNWMETNMKIFPEDFPYKA